MGILQAAARKTVVAGVVNPLPGGTFTASGANADDVQFNANGTVSQQGITRHNWYSPTTTGIGSNYWVRFTVASGDALTYNQAETWTQLSSALYFGHSANNGDTTVTVEISTSSGGTPVVASGSYRVYHTA